VTEVHMVAQPLPPSTPPPHSRQVQDRVELRDLAVQAGGGDRAALNELLTRVRAVAHRYVRSRLWTYPGGEHMVDDVAQEVCVAVFGALNRYRDEGRPFEAFVYAVAARKVADAQRAFAVADVPTPVIPDEPDEAPTPEEHAVRHSEITFAVAQMARLPEKLREILLLRVVAGMSAEETGRALGMTPGAVRVAQHRALNALRGFVGHEAKHARRAGGGAA
jgi:RNA polymerase sigma-70 factor (ECF subfamily)